MVRIGSSTGEFVEAPVNVWLGGGLPPMSSTFLSGFTTRYMDPTEVKARFTAARGGVPEHRDARPAAAQDERLQRKAQATLAANATTLSVATAAGATALRVSSTTGPRRREGHLGRHRREPGAADDRDGRDAEPGVAGTERQPDGAADARARERRPFFWASPAPATRPPATRQTSAVVLTSRAWGHEGGNNVTAELRDPASRTRR